MHNRIATTIVLAEDETHQNFVRRYLQRLWGRDFNDHKIRWSKPQKGRGSGEQHVRTEYPKEVKACRSLGTRVSALLIVIVDADKRTADERRRQLTDSLSAAGIPPRDDADSFVVLIPKRHVETWIRALMQETVDEDTDYTKSSYSSPTPEEIKSATETLYAWTRPNAQLGPTSPPSLTASIPEWKRIPS